MVSINIYGKYCVNIQFYQPQYPTKNQFIEKQEFSLIKQSCIIQNRPKKVSFHTNNIKIF